jgi:hypothetical protein
MREAIAALTQAGIVFERPSRYQLKIGPANFYPGTGRIFVDGAEAAEPERGLQAFLKRVRQAGD